MTRISKKCLGKMLLYVIEESNCGWSSPVVLVKKKGSDTPRISVYFIAMNQVTHRDAHALANLQQSLDTLNDAKHIAMLDMDSGFWQVSLAPADHPKTAFPMCKGLFQVNIMPFDLTNDPSIF